MNFGDNRIVDHPEERETVSVESVQLDDVLHGVAIDVLKMDTQGAEMLILLGMRQLLHRNHSIKILTEFWPEMMAASDYDPKNFLQIFNLAGFSASVIDEEHDKVVPIEYGRILEETGKKKSFSLFFSRLE
ncbi:MAG TPA: FkbM family methyltransferase [Candidatus Paceibacterota bacterium]